MSLPGANLSRPKPIAGAYSGFFWAGAREGRLLVQRCDDCQVYAHPPGPICPRCGSSHLTPTQVSGRGSVHSFTVVRHAFHPAFKDELPYMVARIELEEQPDLVLITNLRDCAPEAARTGLRVRVVFEKVGEDVLPQFVPAEPVQ